MGTGPRLSDRQFQPGIAGAGILGLAREASRFSLKLIQDCAQTERDRWPLWLPVAFGIGIAIYFGLAQEPSSSLGLLFGAAGLLLAIAARGTNAAGGRAALAFIAALLLGFAVAKHRADSIAAPVLTHRVGPIAIEGQVEDVQAHGKGTRLVLLVSRADRLSPRSLPKRIRISFRVGGETLKPGDRIATRAVLMPPPPPAEPNDYDFGRAAYFRQLGAVGFSFGWPQLISAINNTQGLTTRIDIAIERLRWRLSSRIHSVLPGSTGAIASALITGDRGGISEDDEVALRDAGLAHVLAIAGLHMALVGLGLFWAIRALLAAIPSIALTQQIKKWAAGAALASATFYLVISGAATPATRAYVMLAVMLVAILFDRPAISMRSVALAATIILLLRPESITEPGFQMSFAAVIGLVSVAEWECARAKAESTLPLPAVRHYLRGIAITSFVGSVATAPYAAYHFNRATHYAVIGNLGAMPIMAFLTMPAAALSLFLMPFGLDRYPLLFMGHGIEAMLAVGKWVSGLPGSVSLVSAWPTSALVLLSAGGIWIALWRKSWRWLGLFPVAASAVLFLTAKPPDLLIGRDGVTAAIRLADGRLHMVRPPADRYSAEERLKRDGDNRTVVPAIATRHDGISCDDYGCVARSPNGLQIASVAKPDALSEDCARADILLSAVPTRGHCVGPALVIDKFDVSRNGAYAIWPRDGIAVETAREARGERPWSMPAVRTQYRRMRPTNLP